ncbi:MAG: glycosyltransferase family 2 protein [Bacilli bacterium]|nr:glycosyltransferase family 2 protein [Bacilli bacterium]
MPKISVLIPVFNCEKTICRCIDSLLNQTYKDFEVIVVNNCSTDNTLHLLSGYKNIKVYNKKRTTIGDSRNYLIKKCTTDYFFFLDGDDYLENNCLELLYNEIISSQSDLVMGLTDNVLIDKIILDDDKYDYLFNNKLPYFVTCWNKLYRTKVFKDLNFPSYNLAEDEFIIHHILKRTNKIVIVPCKTYNYTISNNGLSSKIYDNFMDAFNAFYDRLLFFENTKYERNMYRRLENYIIEIYCLLKFDHFNSINVMNYYNNIFNFRFSSLKGLIFRYLPNCIYLLRKWRRLKK